MRKDSSALLVKPLVAIRMVEMPVGVYQVFDRIAAEIVDRFEDAGARPGDAGIDKQFAIGPVRTATVPPEPSMIVTLPRSLWS